MGDKQVDRSIDHRVPSLKLIIVIYLVKLYEAGTPPQGLAGRQVKAKGKMFISRNLDSFLKIICFYFIYIGVFPACMSV